MSQPAAAQARDRQRARLLELLAAYGASPAAWPSVERVEAVRALESLLGRDDEVRQAWRAAQSLDLQLRSYSPATHDADALILRVHDRVSAMDRWQRWFRPHFALLPILLGLALGWSDLDGATEEDQMTSQLSWSTLIAASEGASP